ncbi:FAD-dependent oxidoreductase [bacterium]|nr:FAD-dependent oxidoreductase [bacterium]
MGQAAGIAAALCVKNNVAPRNLNAKELQRILVQYGCPLGDEARLKELGLSGVFILSRIGL